MHLNKRIIQKSTKRFHVNRKDMFDSVMANADFTRCKNSLDAVGVMFNQLFPIIEQVTSDNELLLDDQAKQMVQYGELDEKYKLLKQDYEQLQNEYEASTGSRFSKSSNEVVSENQQSLLFQEGSPFN